MAEKTLKYGIVEITSFDILDLEWQPSDGFDAIGKTSSEFSTKGMGFGVILLRHLIYDVGTIERDILKALELLEGRNLLNKEFTVVLSEGRIRIRQSKYGI